ncbi:MAG: hypothetical protein WCO00_04090 [Rhodospirillaceae bacterium]
MPDTIKIGDRYHRPDEPNLVYRVLRLVAFPHHPPHVTLVAENAGRRMMTVGVSVLNDRQQWVAAK